MDHSAGEGERDKEFDEIPLAGVDLWTKSEEEEEEEEEGQK